ncbi:replication factor C subunit 4-like [Daphnia pulicaria]|uniref:replication factor C subunit 4-like n=1 Tax=Daphnia pulicaria TaxID=35523 RepID=UPI001EEA1E18|nr:replication factor C subunit 4-like [Daphnia pulicaria]
MDSFLKTGKLSNQSKGSGVPLLPGNVEEKKHSLIPWVEKYRPRTIDEVSYQEEVVAVLQKSLQGADLPNLLFYGPPGTGKTSTILAAARDLFGDIYKDRVLELNASDERGIQVVREKVKIFSQRTVSSVRPDGKQCPPFKIVILDEADSMTGAAQAALRRTMEKETKSTRFCLICNYVSRIIEPLTSRCSKFRFKPLPREILVKRLEHICIAENMSCSEEVLESLIEASEGDLRRAITFLQSIANLNSEASPTIEDIYEITGRVPSCWIEGLLEKCTSGSYDAMQSFINNFSAEGFSVSQLLNQLHERIVFSTELSSKQKNVICEKLAICDHRLAEGADEQLQLLDLSCTIMNSFQ